MTGNAATPAMKNTFSGLSVPAAPTMVRLHAGIADGQAGATEGAMLFNGVAVSPVDFYDGSDGPLWDDDRMVVPTAQLPAGTTSRSTSLTVGSDCLASAYQALAYQF
jgi:hypothetical protein